MGHAARFYVGPDNDPDRFELIENLGGGTEAEVWRARLHAAGDDGVDGQLDVAIKIFRGGSSEPPTAPPGPPPPPGAGDGGDAATAAAEAATLPLDHGRRRVQDWERRTRLLWQFDHPGIVQLRESFIGPPMHSAGRVRLEPELTCRYVVMEYIDAPSLREWLPLNANADLTQRLRVLRSVAAGLDAMHGSDDGGFPHGDVKPGNILVPPQRQGVLVDFSLMRMGGGPTLATRPYAAPELFTGAPATPASDRFAFFATLFEVATLQEPPLQSDGAGPDVVQMHRMLLDSPQTATRPRLIDAIVNGVSRQPAERPERLLPALVGTVTSTYMNSADLAPRADGAGAADGPAQGGSPGDTRTLTTASVAAGGGGGGEGGRRKRRGRGVLIAAGIVVLALAAGALYVAGAFDGSAGEAAADDSGPNAAATDSPADTGDSSGSPDSQPTEPTQGPDRDRTPEPTAEPTAVAMPSLVGTSIAEARRDLAALGLPVPTIIEVLDEETPSGQVLAQVPEAGAKEPAATELSVATAPVERYLYEMEPIGYGVDDGPVSISGEIYPRSFQDSLSYDAGPSAREWDLGRDFRVLRMTLGLEDTSPIADAQVQFEVGIDGTTIFNERISLGEARLVELDVTGALRLEISATAVTDNDDGWAAYAAFGDPVLLGLPSEVPAEQDGS